MAEGIGMTVDGLGTPANRESGTGSDFVEPAPLRTIYSKRTGRRYEPGRASSTTSIFSVSPF